jgi:hypothetical protein
MSGSEHGHHEHQPTAHPEPHFTPEVHEAPDDWHRHSKAAEGEPQHEHGQRIKTGVLALYFVGISVFTILFILVTVLYFKVYVSDYYKSHAETTVLAKGYLPSEGYLEMQTREGALAAGYSWVLDADGRPTARVRVPIAAAMDAVARKYAAGETVAPADPKAAPGAATPAGK